MSKSFQLESKFSPAGDQPEAISALIDGLEAGEAGMTLLGVTGSGKTFTVGPLGAFGHLDILRGRLRTTTAVAEADSLVLAFGAEDFFDLLSNNVDIVKAIFRYILEHTDDLVIESQHRRAP